MSSLDRIEGFVEKVEDSTTSRLIRTGSVDERVVTFLGKRKYDVDSLNVILFMQSFEI